jgi:HopA1 effector protein family
MSLEETAKRLQRRLKVKNNAVNGIDIEFCQQLHQSNTSSGYINPGWQVVAQTDDAELIVVKDELHLHINPQQHLPQELRQATVGDIVPVYLSHNLVGIDTYIAVGNLGVPDLMQSVQIFFNFTPNAAIQITRELTQALNELGIAFQFAILHNPDLFHRYDTGSLWLSQPCYFAVQTLLERTYNAHQAAFSPHIPLFAKQLAPGLGIAELPAASSTFGEHRCELLAESLAISMEQGKMTTTDKLGIVNQIFSFAGIDWLQPYLSFSTSDCYNIYAIE